MGNTADDLTDSPIAANSAVPQPRKGSFQVSAEPVVPTEADQTAHKFEIAAEQTEAPASQIPEFEDLGQLPSSYQEETLYLVARDPRWLFSYWDFNFWQYRASEMRHGIAQFFLRVSRVQYGEEAMIEIKPEARNWYVAVEHPDADYLVEIGYFDRNGSWQTILRSNIAHTPPDALAPEAEPDFATVPAHLTFERLMELVQERMAEGETLIAALARVAGEGRMQFRPGMSPTWTDDQKRILATLLGDSLVDRLGLGSEEIDQLIRKQLQQKLHSEAASGLSTQLLGEMGPSTQSLFSGIGASWSAQPFSVRAERGFFMHVNAEIIFYGGTHPDATVTINGERIQLSPDGMFRYHFTLPDGDFEIPVVAVSPDQVEQRSATLSFKRGTQRIGEVGSTGQPQELTPLIGQK
ncbi:MAG: DUF4912 domain-containing protein [Verrucomicrobiaceae bacterium]|nr:MAG: DUF4912 domain-containing protein [Verrucomicrobiaceae bacterium]